MVWDQLPAKIKILMKQNYQDKVVLEGENQSPHTLSTPVCLVGVAPYTYPIPEGHHWACTWGSAKLPPGIPPEPLLEDALNLGHQLSSGLPSGPCSWKRGGKQLYEYHINQLKINYQTDVWF